jgi:hypothetical protein
MKPSRQSAVRRAKYAGKNTFSIYVNADIDDLIDGMSADLLNAVRPAAQAAAQVLYEAVLTNVDAIGSVTGNLRGSIYQSFSEEQSVQAAGGGYLKASYHVSWRTAKGTGLPRAPHGHLVEFGHIQKYKVYLGRDGHWYTNKKAPLPTPIQVAARPFIRPASARAAEAADAAQRVLLAAVNGSAQ